MENSTISISPLPESTTVDQVRKIFHAYSVKNVHVQGKTAYVEFNDQSDMEAIELQFEDYEIPELNNAKIDKAENFDWTTVKKEDSFENKKSSDHSSDKHEDLMSADIKNLIVIENCDKKLLANLSVDKIKELFQEYPSVHRIVKKDDKVIVQFLDLAQIQLIDIKFDKLNVPQLGKNSHIQKAQDTNISSDQFSSQWSKMHTEQSQITQATQQLGYQDSKVIHPQEEDRFNFGYNQEKPAQQEEDRFNFGMNEEKNSQQVLHQGIIPPFDKKTSMEVNFLSQQSKLGYSQEKNQHEPIHQADSKQQLDFTSELKIEENQDKLGYEQQQKRQREAEQKRKEEQEQQIKMEKQKQQQRKYEEQRMKKQRQEEEKRRREDQQLRKRRQSEALDRQLKEKLQLQRQKYQKEEQERHKNQKIQNQRQEKQRIQRQRQEAQRVQRQKLQRQLQIKMQQQKAKQTSKSELGYNVESQAQHHIPTQSENASKQAQLFRQAGTKVQKQLGYAVNLAKQQSASLLNAGKQLLKNATDGPQYLGYEKWSVKPDINIPRPVSGTQNQISKTLVTVTLAIWVLLLLFQ